MSIDLKRNDLEPAVIVGLEAPPGVPVDLTGTTVRFIMRLQNSTGSAKVSATAAIVGDPTLGIVKYAWATGDTDTVGTYQAEFEVMFAGARPRTFPGKGSLYIVIDRDLDG